MAAHDQFSRWCCLKCGEAGIDSWNKAVWDGPGFRSLSDVPNPWIIGGECVYCGWPCVVIYTIPEVAPRTIYGPIGPDEEGNSYEYEDEVLDLIEADITASVVLSPSNTRDTDWSGGCLMAQAQIQ